LTTLRHRCRERKPELKLTEELTGSLRTLAPEGDLIAERLDSFKRRNILEIRERQKKKSCV
jgi:nucleolar protein 53